MWRRGRFESESRQIDFRNASDTAGDVSYENYISFCWAGVMFAALWRRNFKFQSRTSHLKAVNANKVKSMGSAFSDSWTCHFPLRELSRGREMNHLNGKWILFILNFCPLLSKASQFLSNFLALLCYVGISLCLLQLLAVANFPLSVDTGSIAKSKKQLYAPKNLALSRL